MIDLSGHILGETAREEILSTREDNRVAATALAAQARRSLEILTHDLDRQVLDHAPFIDALRRFATRNRHTLVRILVHDSTHAVKHDHRLIPLAHRLTGKIQFRNPDEAQQERRVGLIIADGRGVLYRKQADRYEGRVNFDAPKEARDLTLLFDEIWRNGTPDPYIRRLDI